MSLHFLFTICSLIARTHICDPGKYVYICSGARFPAGGCLTSGAKLISDEAIDTLKENLFPLATVLTPNIPEAEVLSGLKINNEEEMLTAAKYIGDHYHCAVLLKGGHQINDANDLLYKEGNYQWFKGKRINNNNTHII